MDILLLVAPVLAVVSATTILSVATIPAWLLLLETLYPGSVPRP